jgi:hypothetical protein
METPRDQALWKKAKNRASFKVHAFTYILVNAALWLIYLFTNGQNGFGNAYPWPIWGMLGWGIGLAFHYFSAYGNMDEKTLAEREYQKLLRKQ